MRFWLLLLAAVLLSAPAFAQLIDQEWIGPDDDPAWFDIDGLPKGMTPEEEALRHTLGADFTPTPPPTGPVRNVSEFERNQAVLIRFPLGIPLQLVAAMSEHVRVVTIVANQSAENQARSAFQSAGVAMTNVQFMHAPTNSVWTRDYGPFYGIDQENVISVVDFPYNRPRPADDAVPAALAGFYGVDRYGMNVVHTGGNYMSTGWGHAASTDLIWEENGFNQTLVLQRMADFLGISKYHVTIDPQADYIKHIDTWAKFLDVDKIVIGRVLPSDSRYADYEAVADYFASQLSPWGTPYQVFRVDTPQGQPYTNALVMNERVYVPISSSPAHATANAAALAVYREALPGYEVLGFTGTWQSTDALHCRVKEIPDFEMLSIRHRPIAGTITYEPSVVIEAEIIAHSGAALIEDALRLYYSINGLPYVSVPLTEIGEHRYAAALPLQPGDVDVAYYLAAADASGRSETFPLIGEPGARRFTVEHGTVEQSYTAGWQLIGLPLERTHTAVGQLFDGAEDGSLLAYEGGAYVAAETLETGRGYWLRLADAQTVTFAGSPVEVPVVTVSEGWNLIGAPFAALPVATIADPDGVLVEHTVRGFEGTYAAAEALAPGYGYWLRARADGVLGLGSAPARPVAAGPELPYDTFHRLTLSSGSAASVLYLEADLSGYEGEPLAFGVPPLPPAGAFDARFAGDFWITTLAQADVLVQHGTAPVELNVDGPEGYAGEYRLRLYAGAELSSTLTLASGGSAAVPATVDRVEVTRLGSSSAEPGTEALVFGLGANYPNPFSGTTQIHYTLAAPGAVRLEVFNVLGQRVATLVDEAQPAGRYSVSLDGRALSSGSYVYRLTAGDSVETRTLMIVR